jgi:hypothetical protein
MQLSISIVRGQPLRYHSTTKHARQNEDNIESPQETQLYNAIKLSDRTNSGLGIGISSLSNLPQTNSLSIGLVYFLNAANYFLFDK